MITDEKILEIYTLALVAFEIEKHELVLTGGASLYCLGLTETPPNDLDFYIQYTNGINLRRKIINAVDSDVFQEVTDLECLEYAIQENILFQIKYNGIKIDLFIGKKKPEVIKLKLLDLVPILSPLVTLEKKFSFYDEKTSKYIKFFKEKTKIDSHDKLKK